MRPEACSRQLGRYKDIAVNHTIFKYVICAGEHHGLRKTVYGFAETR